MTRRATVAGLALALAACATIEISADWNPDTDFSRLHAWAWFPQARPASGDPRLDSGLLDARIRGAIEAELGARGFGKAEAAASDFIVAYHVALERRIEATTIDDFYGGAGYRHWGRPGFSETFVRELEIGTLMLDVLDPRSQQLIWRGTAKAEIVPSSSPEQRDARIREAVRRMLDRFPPPR